MQTCPCCRRKVHSELKEPRGGLMPGPAVLVLVQAPAPRQPRLYVSSFLFLLGSILLCELEMSQSAVANSSRSTTPQIRKRMEGSWLVSLDALRLSSID